MAGDLRFEFGKVDIWAEVVDELGHKKFSLVTNFFTLITSTRIPRGRITTEARLVDDAVREELSTQIRRTLKSMFERAARISFIFHLRQSCHSLIEHHEYILEHSRISTLEHRRSNTGTRVTKKNS